VGSAVELAAPLEVGADPKPTDEAWGISWQVGDADAAQARLAEAGFDVSPVRKGRRPGTRVFSLRGDPCGVATLFLEPPARGAER
jgi:hypothetical protein